MAFPHLKNYNSWDWKRKGQGFEDKDRSFKMYWMQALRSSMLFAAYGIGQSLEIENKSIHRRRLLSSRDSRAIYRGHV